MQNCHDLQCKSNIAPLFHSHARTHAHSCQDMPAKWWTGGGGWWKWNLDDDAYAVFRSTRPSVCRVCWVCCALCTRCAWNHCDNNAHTHTLTHTHSYTVLTCGKEQTKRKDNYSKRKIKKKTQRARSKRNWQKICLKHFPSTLHLPAVMPRLLRLRLRLRLPAFRPNGCVFSFCRFLLFLNFWFVIVARVVFCLCYDNLCLAGNWAAMGHTHTHTHRQAEEHTLEMLCRNSPWSEPSECECKWKSLRKQMLKQQQKFSTPAMNEWSLFGHSRNNIILSRRTAVHIPYTPCQYPCPSIPTLPQ